MAAARRKKKGKDGKKDADPAAEEPPAASDVAETGEDEDKKVTLKPLSAEAGRCRGVEGQLDKDRFGYSAEAGEVAEALQKQLGKEGFTRKRAMRSCRMDHLQR